MTPPKMSSDLRREFYIYHCTNIQHHPQTSQPYYFIGIKDWLLKILTRMSSQSDTAILETYLKSSVGLISKNINEYLNFKFRFRFWKMMNFWNTPEPWYSEPRYSEILYIVNKSQLPLWDFIEILCLDIVNDLI